MAIENRAADLAAKATGLRPDQIAAAVEEYRSAAMALETEPEWQTPIHMSGPGWGLAQWHAEGTEIVLQMDSWEHKAEWRSERTYHFGGEQYELYAEARSVELGLTARPTPRAVE